MVVVGLKSFVYYYTYILYPQCFT